MGAEVHLQSQEEDEVLLQGGGDLDVPLASGVVPVHQHQDGVSGAEVSLDGIHLVEVDSADPGFQVGAGVPSGLDICDLGEETAQVNQDFLGLVVSDVTDGEQLPEGARVVTGLSGDLVVVDHGGFEVSNAVVDELEGELHGGHGELVVFRQVVLVHWLLPGEGRGTGTSALSVADCTPPMTPVILCGLFILQTEYWGVGWDWSRRDAW